MIGGGSITNICPGRQIPSRRNCDVATHCRARGKALSKTNPKVRHHYHVSGVFLYAACNNCNLQLKVTSRKRKRQHDDDDDDDDDDEKKKKKKKKKKQQ